MIENDQLVKAIIEGAQEKKGRSIVHVNLENIEQAPTQGFVIVNGNTPIQVEAVADSIREYVEKTVGVRPYNYDGYQNSQWIVIDYGTIFAHVFLPDYRNRYNLEQLWADAIINQIPDLD
ncbi:MAG: ribosome silencing factor [Muribaculaceae bacterium]|nr:ribosome silencing factor [Muribaculaceae bacterium]